MKDLKETLDQQPSPISQETLEGFKGLEVMHAKI
jgi:hypothetical protein